MSWFVINRCVTFRHQTNVHNILPRECKQEPVIAVISINLAVLLFSNNPEIVHMTASSARRQEVLSICRVCVCVRLCVYFEPPTTHAQSDQTKTKAKANEMRSRTDR